MEFPRIALGRGTSPARKTGPRKEWELSGPLREEIAACAREDAARGVYMGPAFLRLRQAEVETVAPDRAALERAIHIDNARAEKEAREADERWLRLLSGERYRVKRQSRGAGSAIHVLDESGDEIMTYTAGAGWQRKESKAENRVHSALKMAYLDAYRAARKELPAAQGGLETEA